MRMGLRQPDFSLTRDLLFLTTSGWRNPLIAIDWKTGKVQENTSEICCVRHLDDWSVAGTYFFLSDSGTFHLLDLPSRKFSALNLDSLFGFSPGHWYDLDYTEGRISATFASGDSLWLVDMRLSDRAETRIPLPPPPKDVQDYGKLETMFGPNSEYLRVGRAGGGFLIYMIPLESLRSAPDTSAWVPESRFTFNQDLTAKSMRAVEKYSGPLDSAHIVFMDRDGKVLVDYDFSSRIRK